MMYRVGDTIKTLLQFTDAPLTGTVVGHDTETDRVKVLWSDGIESSERPEYITKDEGE